MPQIYNKVQHKKPNGEIIILTLKEANQFAHEHISTYMIRDAFLAGIPLTVAELDGNHIYSLVEVGGLSRCCNAEMAGIQCTICGGDGTVCPKCGGTGEVMKDGPVYPGEPHMAAVDSEVCPECHGKD
jgi:hypothetical protein